MGFLNFSGTTLSHKNFPISQSIFQNNLTCSSIPNIAWLNKVYNYYALYSIRSQKLQILSQKNTVFINVQYTTETKKVWQIKCLYDDISRELTR